MSTPSTIDLVVAERKKEIERRRVIVDGDSVTASAVDDTAAEVVFTVTPVDVDAMRRNELDLSVAFMRGTMKMAGDSGVLFHVLPVLTRHASLLVGSE